MTICNYCSYQNEKARAKERGMVATLSSRGANFGLGGVNLYIHPKDVKLSKLSDDELAQYDGHHWFMSVPDGCCCDDTDYELPVWEDDGWTEE